MCSFATVFAKHRAKPLDAWIAWAKRGGISRLASSAAGLLADLDAGTADVTLPCNSGVAEGRVTDLIKRQMAGRAGIQLLRKHVILVAHSRRPPQPPAGDDLWATTGYENLV
ncbi:hypothetical protein [Streptomyces sp. NPDC048385]|uniref:hypothetical protein n=1 Tax=Streptomyces sp. NPDC048385 TaxID=3155145 RepID=UPI003412617A